MSIIKVISPGLLSSIQDSGRFGYEQVGVSASGVMDSFAHRIANILVGNPETEAVLEITMMGPALEFSGDARIAITGAQGGATVDGVSVGNWQSVNISAGSVLKFAYATKGVRSYLAISGGFDIPVVMGSKSTYMRAQIGGFEGRALQPGDEIPYTGHEHSGSNVRVPDQFIPTYNSELELRVVLGPQDDYFTPDGIKTFFTSAYTVSLECDRMGYRLDGSDVEHNEKGSDIISDGMTMGGVQIPGNGKPIILMADRQTTGGYTKIGCVISADLPKIAQAKTGDVFSFKQVTVDNAQDVFIENEENIQRIKNSLITVDSLKSHGGTIYRMKINGKEYKASIYEEL